MKNKFIIAIDLGGTNLKVGLTDLNYKILRKKIIGTHTFKKKEALIEGISSAAVSVAREYGLSKSEILGVGVGLPGPVDKRKGIVHFLPNIPGWKDIALKRILESKLSLAVAIDNDAKLMCLAEHRLGAAKGKANVVCITLGTGVGGGFIIGGELYRGANNASAEIGHFPLNEDGPLCGCGSRGCLEAYIGSRRIMQQARQFFKHLRSLEELSSFAAHGNKQALRIWKSLGEHLGNALAGVVNLLNPDCIVVGGGIAAAGRIFFPVIKKTITKKAMPVQAGHVKILKAKLGSDAGLIGAAILVKEGFLK